jgi:hypothetical protein
MQGDVEYQLRSLVSDFDHEDVNELSIRGHAARTAVLETAPENLCERIKAA